jgi:U3 small nucleolar RNA-associated protein 15
MDYQRLVVLKDAPPVAKHSPESRYWRTFKHPLFVKEYAQITAVHFAQSQPHKYAVTVGTQVQVYSPKTHKVTKTIARFKDTTRSACIRPDGKLLAAADDSGLIQIFDLNSRAVLRTLSGHRQPTHSVSFSTALQTQLLSASDDTTVRLWDIPSETELLAFKEHTDYVRSAQIAPENPSIVVSGSYDHSVKLFDTRTGHCEMTLESTPAASFPVEKVLIFPSSTLVSAACGPMMRTWDIVSGGRCLRTVSNHQKSITSLCFTSNSKRILSASLDRLVKVYDTENFNVVHTMRYPSPLLCVATSPDDKTIVAGMTDGTLSIRRRKDGRQEDRPELTSDVISFPSFGELSKKSPPNRSQDAHGVRVSSRRQKKMHDYDRLLKAFKYSAALDAVVGRVRQSFPPRPAN